MLMLMADIHTDAEQPCSALPYALSAWLHASTIAFIGVLAQVFPNAAKHLRATDDQGLRLSMLKSVNKTSRGYIKVWQNSARKVK